jgi:hypothetical protein
VSINPYKKGREKKKIFKNVLHNGTPTGLDGMSPIARRAGAV